MPDYKYAFMTGDKGYFRNTAIVAATRTVGQLLLCSMAAYAFARIKFPGRELIFILFLSVPMIPYQIFIIPQYMIMKDLGWLNTIKGLIVPGLFSSFGTFLLRQFFMTLPKELEEAAKLDGRNHFRIYRSIMLPVVVPGLIALAIFTTLAWWSDLLWPIIVNHSPDKLTLAAGLASLRESIQQTTCINGRYDAGYIADDCFIYVVAKIFY